MSEVIEKKLGIKFTYVKKEDETMIHAIALDSELPGIMASLTPGIESTWKIHIWECRNQTTIFDGVCYRGRSFAERVARNAIKACFSKLGKKRRATANKQKKQSGVSTNH